VTKLLGTQVYRNLCRKLLQLGNHHDGFGLKQQAPPDPNPPYMFQTPPPQWGAYNFLKPTPGCTHWHIIQTSCNPSTLIYVAAANKTTTKTHAIMTQKPTHHDNNTTPIPVLSSNTNPVDNLVKSTFGSTKQQIVCT